MISSRIASKPRVISQFVDHRLLDDLLGTSCATINPHFCLRHRTTRNVTAFLRSLQLDWEFRGSSPLGYSREIS
jgi:hypothetical protein